MQTTSPLLRVENIHLRHLRGSNVFLRVFPGEIIGLSGENGAGKTTLLRYLAGLEPDSAGKFYTKPSHSIRYGLVCQNPENNLIFSSLKEDVKFGLRNIGEHFSEDGYQTLTSFFDLDEGKQSIYQQMSSGTLERAALASIWSQHPEVLLLDEAFSRQSGAFAEKIFSKMIRETKESGNAIILATHEPGLLKMTDRILELKDGFLTEISRIVPGGMESDASINSLLDSKFLIRMNSQPLDSKGRMGLVTLQLKDRPNEIMNELIQLNNVSFAFPGKPVFNNLSCKLTSGKLYYLYGPSGCGKSTLLSVMAGLLPVSSGQVLINGKLLSSSDKKNNRNEMKEIRKKIGYMDQHAERSLFCGSVWEDTVFGLKNFGITGAEMNAMGEKALLRLGISKALWDRAPHQLSIGEQRKAALAGVAAYDPEILLLDDPYSELDEKGIQSVNKLIVDFLRENRTVVITGTEGQDV